MRTAAWILSGLIVVGALAVASHAQNPAVAPSDDVTITISDWDLNSSPLGVDRYEEPEFVVFRTSRDDLGEAHPEIVETGPSTGVFEFTIQLKTDETACRQDRLDDPKFKAKGGSNPSIGACPGDLLFVQYKDNRGTGGQSSFVDYLFDIKSWDPQFEADRPSYFVGDRVTVSIYDPDANRDPDVPDSLSDIRVFSESDPAGAQFSAIETGRDTGVFKLTFTTSLQPQGSSILIRGNEEVTVQYVDDFPADFSLHQDEKEFNFSMIGWGPGDGANLLQSRPSIDYSASAGQAELLVGQQATISTEITNQRDAAVPFTAIFDVRDQDGVTVFIAWQSTTVGPHESSGVGISWIPHKPGLFSARTFLISDLENPQILSPVSSSEVTVAAAGN